MVVSEYVDVANAFVDRDETGMVNAVLDARAPRRVCEPAEFVIPRSGTKLSAMRRARARRT